MAVDYKTTKTLVASPHHDMATIDHGETLRELATVMGCSPEHLREFGRCISSIIRCTPQIETCIPKVESSCKQINALEAQLEKLRKSWVLAICPANVLYSQRTTSRLSSHNSILFKDIVTGLGDPYVDTFPVPPAKRLRRRIQRAGFCPAYIRGDFNLANNATNYSDIELQFYISGEEHGSSIFGNQLLMKSGNEVKYEFPPYEGMPIIIGSLDTLEVDIINNGPNNLESANIFVHNDVQRWYELCGPGPIGTCSTGC